MEIERENGSKISLVDHTEIGRGFGLDSNDKTLSRRQISLSLNRQPSEDKPSVRFEVTGKNPVWLYHCVFDEIKVYKRGEVGEMEGGDRFCLSGRRPVWFSVRERGDERESRGVVDLEAEIEGVDVSALDPVKEFGFLVIGHEFDHYPKHKISPPKTWDWFLEEPKKESDDETDGRKRNRSTRRKRKKGDGNHDDDDDEWTGESEEDKDLISKSKKVQRPKYSTRSKGRDKPAKDKEKDKSSNQKKIVSRDEEDDEEEEEDEDDDTLGGFIVKDDEVKEDDDDDEDSDKTELDEEEDDFEEDDDED